MKSEFTCDAGARQTRLTAVVGATIAAMALAAASPAAATVVDFSGFVAATSYNTGAPIQSQGFQFDTPGIENHVNDLAFLGTSDPFNANPTGTTIEGTGIFPGVARPLLMTKVGGGGFNFLSVDLADAGNNGSLVEVTLTGTFADNSQITQTIDTDAAVGLQTVLLTGFTDVVSVFIDSAFGPATQGRSSGFVAQYVNFDTGDATIPEPASLALLSLGLVGLTLARRRRASA